MPTTKDNNYNFLDIEFDIKLIDDDPEKEIKKQSRIIKIQEKQLCECGAHATINPNLHSSWCPAFQSIKKRKK